MKVLWIFSLLVSLEVGAAGFTDAYLKENLGRVIQRTQEILRKAQSKGNPYASRMLSMINPSRIEFTEQDTVLAEYIAQSRKILVHKVPAKYSAFDRDFMINSYYPAVLVHEATHDIVRVSPRNIETLHGKEFARVCLSVIKDSGVPFAMRDGWSRGMDFGISKYLDFQLRLSEKNSPYEILEGNLGVSKIRLRSGVLFSFMRKSLIAGNNVVLHVQDLQDLSFDPRTKMISFGGRLKNILPQFDGLPLDVTLPTGTELELLSGITVRANRDSFIRAFHFDNTGALWGINLMRDFPGLINASFSVSSDSVKLADVAGVSFGAANSALDLVVLENNIAPVEVPLADGKILSLKKIEGTLMIGRGNIRCSSPAAHGDFEEVSCRVKTTDGKVHTLTDTTDINSEF